MKKSYQLNRWKPIKMVSEDKGNTIDNNGNGWYNQDLSQFIKINWQKENGKWVAVEGATQDEILERQKQSQLEQINALNQKWKDDGMSYYNEIKNQITVSLIGKSNAMSIMAEINKTVYPLLNKIKEGDWPLAVLDYTDNQNTPTIQEVIDLFNQVGQKAVEYYQNEYPH